MISQSLGVYKCIKEYTNSLLIHLSNPQKGIKVHNITLYLYNVWCTPCTVFVHVWKSFYWVLILTLLLLKKKKLLFSFKGPPKIVQKYILNSSPTIYHDIIYLGITGIVPRLNYPLQNRSTNWKLNWIYFLLTIKYCHFLGIFF